MRMNRLVVRETSAGLADYLQGEVADALDVLGRTGRHDFDLIVDDVDGCLERVRQGGAEVMEEREDGEFGRFGWFLDPEGNKVELWQPPERRLIEQE